MNDLIKINIDTADHPTVMGRELHEALKIKTPYKKWFDRMCEYGFTENSDYIAIGQKCPTAQGNMTTYTDHQLTLDMAKEICMIQRSDIGRKCRQYFIEVEKQWNSPEAIMHRALALAEQKIKQLEIERANLPISAEQERALRDEITVKAIDLCVSGRVYLTLGLKVKIAIDEYIYNVQNVNSLRDLAAWQYDSAVEMCRRFKPDKKLRELINSELKKAKGA